MIYTNNSACVEIWPKYISQTLENQGIFNRASYSLSGFSLFPLEIHRLKDVNVNYVAFAVYVKWRTLKCVLLLGEYGQM